MRAVLALLFLASSILPAQVIVSGRVVDENSSVVSGARVEFRPSAGGPQLIATSDNQGRFQVELPQSGEYNLHAERPGFFVLKSLPVGIRDGENEINVTLNHLRELVESVDVTYSPPAIDPQETTEQKQLNSMEILDVPYPAAHDVRNALPLLSGVIQDNRGQLHFNGGATDQTNYNLDGFNVADPVTGLFEARLSIDAVRSLDLESSRFSVDKGRGSAASLDIRTAMGDDRWRFGAINFIPGVTAEHGLFINKWTPRITVSGPIARGRAWFQNGFDTFYSVDTVRELPPGQDRKRSITTSNLSRFQVNLTPSNILTGSFLVNYVDANQEGLSFLSPLETTVNRRHSLYMATVKEQRYFTRGALVEFGFAFTRALTRENPQGNATYEFSPNGNRGNYFVDLTRHSDRQQWIGNVFLPPIESAGRHQLKFGADLQRSGFDGDVTRHDYLVLRADGTLARRVFFEGPGVLHKTNFEYAVYGQDQWFLREGLLLALGLRADWDQIVRDTLFAPRASVAWSPRWMRETKFAAGFGVFDDSLSLGTLTRHQDQISLSTFYTRTGQVARGPVASGFLVDEHTLRVPRARMLSLTVERSLPFGFYGKAGYLRRTGGDGFTFVEPKTGLDGPSILYTLANRRGDRYNSLELSARRSFAGRFEWFGGYTWSRARSNAVVDYSLENPIFAPQAAGALDWDAPQRLLTWGWAPLPRRILPPLLRQLLRETSVNYLVESRSGFPFSIVNEDGFLVGRTNGRRLPAYFNVNLHLERKFRFLQYLWAFRFGFNNLTDHANPNVVNNNIDSPQFLTYGGGQSRAFTVRFRFLGRR